MSDETSTAVAEAPAQAAAPKNVSQVFDDPFGGSPATSPAMEMLNEELGRREVEIEPTEEEMLPGEEMSAEEILATFTGEQKPQAEEAEPEVDPFDAVLTNLNELAGKILGNQAVEAPAEVAPEPVAPPAPVIPQPVLNNYFEQMTEDELIDTLTDPVRHHEYMNAFAQKVQLDTMAQMQKAMFAASFEAIYAERYAEEVAQKYPKAQSEAGNLVILAYQQAKQKHPNGTYREIADEANKAIGAVMSKKANIEKSGQKKDVRGRFVPEKATRTTRPSAGTQRVDQTEEAFGKINALSAGRGSDLLNIFGP